MKFTVGVQYHNKDFIDYIITHKQHIGEVYFSWGDFANGRTNQLYHDVLTPWELQVCQMDVLKRLSDEGIALNLLFNANCYGKDSQSRAFFHKIGMSVDYICEHYSLKSVTTTSPLIAKFIKDNFEDLAVRASVNMEIGTMQGMDYLSTYFDSFYMKRELNRDFEKIEELSTWCNKNGKKLHMLANSGCLNHCSAHNFHDNLVAHEQEIAQMDNAYHFTGICREYLKEETHYLSLIYDTNFVRPEDIYKYEKYFDEVKLATRINKAPVRILSSYINGKYSGNLLELLESAHSIYPYVIENGEPLRIIRLDAEK